MIDFFLTFLILVLLIILYFHKKQARIKRWQFNLNLPKHQQTFLQLYQEVNGFVISRKARAQRDAFDYVYGEIEFLPFIALLSLTAPNEETVFYDLGCGVGKAVLACAMVYPVKRSMGVELFSELYLCACEQRKKLMSLPTYKQSAKKIEFICGNFLEVDLSDATLIFVNAVAFIGDTWNNLCSRLQQLPQLTTVITMSKTFQSSTFYLKTSTRVQMSWGVVLAYIYIRKNKF